MQVRLSANSTIVDDEGPETGLVDRLRLGLGSSPSRQPAGKRDEIRVIYRESLPRNGRLDCAQELPVKSLGLESRRRRGAGSEEKLRENR